MKRHADLNTEILYHCILLFVKEFYPKSKFCLRLSFEK